MADLVIYTRAYSESSAGQLISAKGPEGDPLPDDTLADEFRNHADKWNREPTALVSASDRIVDSVKRAFDKHYKDGESPADIWIAFVGVPPTAKENGTRVHSAKELARKCEHPEPNLFSHEVVFEWTIPEQYVLHKVSLQTLMKRGLQEHCYLPQSTAAVRQYTARKIQRSSPWENGIALGSFARKFGARAPLNWISHQLFHDCVRVKIEDDDVVKLCYAHGHTEFVDFQFFGDLDEGIDTSLCEWWLSDIDFSLDCEEFYEMRDWIEDSMIWDLVEFWETWHDVNRDGKIKKLSAKEKLSYVKERNKLMVKHKKQRVAIEAEAVKIGL